MVRASSPSREFFDGRSEVRVVLGSKRAPVARPPDDRRFAARSAAVLNAHGCGRSSFGDRLDARCERESLRCGALRSGKRSRLLGSAGPLALGANLSSDDGSVCATAADSCGFVITAGTSTVGAADVVCDGAGAPFSRSLQ